MLTYGKVVDQIVVSAKSGNLKEALESIQEQIDTFLKKERTTEVEVLISPTQDLQIVTGFDSGAFYIYQQWLVIKDVD